MDIRRIAYLFAPPILRAISRKISAGKNLRAFAEAIRTGDKLHLGCGDRVLEGWINVDAKPGPGILRHDLTMPFPPIDGRIRYIYTEHFIEHVTHGQALSFLRECHRLMDGSHNGGAYIRISTPDLSAQVQNYIDNRIEDYEDLKWKPLNRCHMLNESLRAWGHQFVYDEAELCALLLEAGFKNPIRVAWCESAHEPFRNMETRPFHNDLIVEAQR